ARGRGNARTRSDNAYRASRDAPGRAWRRGAVQSYGGASGKAVERPGGAVPHQGRWIVEPRPHSRDQRGAGARVADRIEHVAQKAVAADALDRGAGEQSAKPGIVEPRQLGEARRGQRLAREEIGFRRRAGIFVPRARGKAIVAAEDAVADQWPQLVRDRAFVL